MADKNTTMGQRKKGKKKTTFWLNEVERGILQKYAEMKEVTMTDAFRDMLVRIAMQNGIKCELVNREIGKVEMKNE